MTEKTATPIERSPSERIAYLVGRRDALNSFYHLATNKPNFRREEIVEILRLSVLEADRKLKKEINAANST